LLSTRGYCPDAVTFRYWPFSVGQAGDFHPAVHVRSQAHERRALLGTVELVSAHAEQCSALQRTGQAL